MRSAAAATFDNDSKLVTVQRMAMWSEDGSAEGSASGTFSVYHNGFPEVVDILAMAPWPVIRGGLRRWHVGQSDTRGCLALSRPEPVRHDVNALAVEDIPTVCLLEALANSGWQHGQTPEAHTALSPKRFTVSDPLASRAYLRCLLRLDDLLGPGKMAELRPKQLALYYSCVLATDRPQLVPLGQDGAAYKRLLDSGQSGPSGDVAAIQDVDYDDDEVMIFDDRPAPSAAKGRPRQAIHDVAKKAAKVQKGQPAWQSLVVAPQASAAICDHGGQLESQAAELALVPLPAEGTVAADSIATGGQPAAEISVDAADVAVTVDAKGRVVLHGQPVSEEKHGLEGQSNFYRRAMVVCRHHGSPTDPCGRTRKFDTREAVNSGLGELEPLAFLGCWLRASGQHESKSLHKGYVPTIAERQAYARAHLDWRG